jgi:hypothetical protein
MSRRFQKRRFCNKCNTTKHIGKFYLFGVYWPVCKNCKLRELKEKENLIQPELSGDKN